MSDTKKELPDYLQNSQIYSLYLILEAMEPEPDDADDKRMQLIFSLVEDAELLQCSPEEVLQGRKAAANPVGDIPVAVNTTHNP